MNTDTYYKGDTVLVQAKGRGKVEVDQLNPEDQVMVKLDFGGKVEAFDPTEVSPVTIGDEPGFDGI